MSFDQISAQTGLKRDATYSAVTYLRRHGFAEFLRVGNLYTYSATEDGRAWLKAKMAELTPTAEPEATSGQKTGGAA